MIIQTTYLGLSNQSVSEFVTTGNRLSFPVWVDESKFKTLYSSEISKPTLTPEKAIFIALTSSKKATARRLPILN